MPSNLSKLRTRIQLSQQEIYGISRAISRDFSPLLFASKTAPASKIQFSSQELLDISRQISQEYAPKRSSQQSRLVLLAVSPTRLHTYWHIGQRRSNQLSKQDDQQPMTLRIYTQPKSDLEQTVPNDTPIHWFDVSVNSDDGQQDIYLSEPIPASSPFKYRAVLGENKDNHTFTPLIYSNTAAAYPSIPPQERNKQSNPNTQFIMSLTHASSTDKTASGQGK